METGAEEQRDGENKARPCADSASDLTGATAKSSQLNVDTNNNQSSGTDACESLTILYKTLEEPIPDNPSASYISDAAHRLVEGLNAKRKNDAEIIEKFRTVLNAQTTKYLQTLEQKLYQMYDVHNSQVDKKLQDLFGRLDNIAAAETELDNFRESLSKLYEEMHKLA